MWLKGTLQIPEYNNSRYIYTNPLMIQKCSFALVLVLVIAVGCKKNTPSPLARMAGMRTWSGVEEQHEQWLNIYQFDTSFALSLSFPMVVLNNTTIVLHDTSFFGSPGDTLRGSVTNNSSALFSNSYQYFDGAEYVTVNDVVTLDYSTNLISWQFSDYTGNDESVIRTLNSVK